MPPGHRWTGVNLEAVSRIVRAQFLRNFLSTEAENMFQLPTTVLSLVLDQLLLCKSQEHVLALVGGWTQTRV